ncbi:hypothetical protein VTO42DRAFT_5722 [Malbranchea cinnamomea]
MAIQTSSLDVPALGLMSQRKQSSRPIAYSLAEILLWNVQWITAPPHRDRPSWGCNMGHTLSRIQMRWQ